MRAGPPTKVVQLRVQTERRPRRFRRVGLVDHLLGFVDQSLAASYGAKAWCVRRDFRPRTLRSGVLGGKMNDLLKPALFRIVFDCDSSISHTSRWQRFHLPYTSIISHDRASARSSPFDPTVLPAISGAPYRIDTSHLLSLLKMVDRQVEGTHEVHEAQTPILENMVIGVPPVFEGLTKQLDKIVEQPLLGPRTEFTTGTCIPYRNWEVAMTDNWQPALRMHERMKRGDVYHRRLRIEGSRQSFRRILWELSGEP